MHLERITVISRRTVQEPLHHMQKKEALMINIQQTDGMLADENTFLYTEVFTEIIHYLLLYKFVLNSHTQYFWCMEVSILSIVFHTQS